MDPHHPAKVHSFIERQDIDSDAIRRLQERVKLLEGTAAATERRMGKCEQEGANVQKDLISVRLDVKKAEIVDPKIALTTEGALILH